MTAKQKLQEIFEGRTTGYMKNHAIEELLTEVVFSNFKIGETEIGSKTGLIGLLDHTVSVTNILTDLTNLKAFFIIPEGANAYIGETLQESGVNINDYTLPVEFILKMYEGTDNEITTTWTVTATHI
ncbi:MAG: hypothetical protein JXR68_14195 [Bacteroidales bacterium]|nr:hypothetical protein [Bacteroidales bacterium]